MHLFQSMKEEILNVVAALQKSGDLPEGLSLTAITAEPPRDPAHGDIATNAAMVLAKPAGLKPRDLAEKIIQMLERVDGVQSVEIAGPGFINVSLAQEKWQQQLLKIGEQGEGWGSSELGADEKVNVEYVSANPTGPMHIGHARGAVVGDALAGVLEKAGYEVTREYYINDAGGQVDTLARSAYIRYLQALGDDIEEIPEGLYPGDYLIPVGEYIASQYKDAYRGKEESEWLDVIRAIALEQMMELIKKDLSDLGITHDVFASEKELSDAGKVEEAQAVLEQKGLTYVGVLEPPKGKRPDDWEARPQTLFKSTRFGDDVDRAIKKSDGSWTYFAPDIAYHLDKFQRGHRKMVNIFGADHSGYVKRLKAAVKAMTDGQGELEILLCQLVKFMEGGEPIKMSKRAGTFTTVRDVIDAVGKDVIRFIMLTRKSDAPLDFDLVKVKEQSKDNPVFYVQYAHARAHSVLRNAKETMPKAYEKLQNPDPDVVKILDKPQELALIKRMSEWPRVVESAALSYEPQRIAYYLQDVAAAFHALWNSGNEDETMRFLIEGDTELTAARLVLIRSLATTIASGLQVIGVTPLEEMRG